MGRRPNRFKVAVPTDFPLKPLIYIYIIIIIYYTGTAGRLEKIDTLGITPPSVALRDGALKSLC